MPTTFATMSKQMGLKERVPFHHHDIRKDGKKPPIARVKPKATGSRRASGKTKGQTRKG